MNAIWAAVLDEVAHCECEAIIIGAINGEDGEVD